MEERLFHATRTGFALAPCLPSASLSLSLSLSLCFDQVEFHLAVPTAGGGGGGGGARSFPSSFPNRNQQPLNRSSYEKHAQQKEGKERREERSILTPPTEADDRFLFARLNKFPVSVS